MIACLHWGMRFWCCQTDVTGHQPVLLLPVAREDTGSAIHLPTSILRPDEPSLTVVPYRMIPVCPNEYRPGCGHTVRPCGSMPTLILRTLPVVVSMA